MRTFCVGQLPCANAGAALKAAPAATLRSRVRRVSMGIGESSRILAKPNKSVAAEPSSQAPCGLGYCGR